MFDLIRTIVLMVYAGMKIVAFRKPDSNEQVVDEQDFTYILALLSLASWFRTLSYLRIFQRTRVLIRLIVEVLIDMVPFLIVLLIALTGFTITYRALQDDQSEGMMEAFKHNYRLMFGDFQPDNYSSAGWVLFVISSTLMTLVMLNMLIAIMSDTYARVMGQIIPADY